ncbi:AraC family transcriptional regulator [Amycolatopsis acidiphila]|uniref:AraC family transcriptional regulator n=1 Tax=Amycolatopsis acidiphila TaxID=715473 RepID=A0A558ADP4_9PSEU|nr:AraC family transcriptional regulator [Amycolatopsis acidiphila]TVT22390.1 AraC family transcriptional regulator [Amycolatopsis acidiphila]UIJ57588.1 AraC family transcriptional regulator [Amycolatopsis acidiphila]GHG89662.1 transcriptional regulator [Amycolatopsis acidiphila]
MTDVLHPLDETNTSGDLLAEIRARTPELGGNAGGWPGLTLYRFTQPTSPHWDEVKSLSLCIIAQGRKCVVVDGTRYVYDPFNYLVLSSSRHFTAEILEATPAKPFLSLVLQIEPALVRRISADILDRRTTTFGRSSQGKPESAFVTPLDCSLMGATMRFLRATDTGPDRRVLAPVYLQEMVYRVLQAEQYARLLEVAATEVASNPVSKVISYVQENISEPLTVSDMAERVALSPSAFSHLFRDVTGKSPYQFVKEMRLNRARELLIEGRLSVTQVSRAVGYSSTSHFINEFRDRFGATPRAYCDLDSLKHDLRVQKM